MKKLNIYWFKFRFIKFDIRASVIDLFVPRTLLHRDKRTDSMGTGVEKKLYGSRFLIRPWRIGTIIMQSGRFTWSVKEPEMRYRGRYERDRGGYRTVKRGCGPIKGFYRYPIRASFPRFLNKKWKEEKIIIVALSAYAIERSFGVMLQEHDAGMRRRCQTRQQPWMQQDLIYLFI